MDTLGLIGIVLSAFAVLIALPALQKHFDNKRLEKFREMQKIINEKSYFVRKTVADWMGLPLPHYLLHSEQWNHTAGQPLMPIDDIVLVADNKTYDYAPVLKSVRKHITLPKRKACISDNLRLYSKSRLYNNPTYGLSALDCSGGKVTVAVKRGMYFDFVDTCLGYGYEAAYENLKNTQDFILRLNHPVTEYNNRFALIGIVTLVILKNVGPKNARQCYCLIHDRGMEVSESQGLINAIPGATFQPSKAIAEKELATALSEEGLKHTVIREFLEEILGVEECSELTDPDQLEKSPAWQVMENSIYYLGCGINPLNAYLELLSCAVIDMNKPEAKALFGVPAKKTPNIPQISLKVVGNFEGSIQIHPLTMDRLKYYEYSQKSAPALSQICKVLREDYGNISAQLGIY